MKQKVIIFGGKGFVGSSVAKILEKKYSVFTSSKRKAGKNHITANILDLKDLKKAIPTDSIVINLVGLSPINKPSSISYEQAHVTGLKNIISVSKQKKVKRFIHMSALGADKKSKNEYLRTKGLGEELVKNSKLNYTIFCPSVIYDQENELIKTLDSLSPLRTFPKIPAKLQPVYRADLAKLFKLATDGKIKERKIKVAGPEKLSLFEMAKLVFNSNGHSCVPLPISPLLFGMHVLKNLSLFGIDEDKIQTLKINNVTSSKLANKYVKFTKFSVWVKKRKN